MDTLKDIVKFITPLLGVILGFFAPRFWDLLKRRLERRLERSPLEREFPEPNDRQLLELFCKELCEHLDHLDEQAYWGHTRFVPLDAEINVLQGERKRRRVMDLFAGIRAYRRAHLFLVIGDPGSGKSVALRKLSRKLLDKAVRVGQIPIYVNLREWLPLVPWSKDNPPKEEHLREFLLQNVKDRVSVSFHGFLDQWLLKLLDRGRLFLIFDSFDEIPAVMDSEASSWLVHEVSAVVARTARGGGNGRAVLASRPFRRPRLSDEDRGRYPKLRRGMPVFELRPFNDMKIAMAIDQAAKDPDQSLRNPGRIKHVLFRERPDLASIARTPFMLGLMIDFWEAQPGRMLTSQADLYESFVTRSLRRAEEAMREHGLGDNDVLACAAAIAEAMFNAQGYGLDMPVVDLAEQLPDLPVEGVTVVLQQARIARPSKSATFSFIHRRFHEYFLLNHFRSNPDSLPYTSIPFDTRWREDLVLFCEIADEPVARRIAEFCWAQIRDICDAALEIGSDDYRHSLHSLRFLATAFRARRHLLASFEPELAGTIDKAVHGTDILTAKQALEASGVLSDENAQRTISTALSSGYPG